MVIDAGNYGELAHAAVAGRIKLRWKIQIASREVVQQGGLEIVIVIKSRDMTVIRYARLLPIDHRRERVLREGERATVVIRQ